MKPSRPLPEAFSMVEVLAAIAIIGVITFLAVPNIVRVKQDGEDNLARARAETLNLAIASLVQANGGTAAQTAWSANSTDAGRFATLRNYIAFSETNWTSYMPNGYGVTNWPTNINPPNSKVRAVRSADSVILY
jgi:type II secretory pathway pseudopilin PulG